MKFIGIDISKATFDVAVLEDGVCSHKKFNNNSDGFKSCLVWIKPLKEDAVFCLEATGIYGIELAKFLFQKQQKVMMVNPIKTNAFCKLEMSRNKTDKADAESIARYTQHVFNQGNLEKSLFKPKDECFERLQYLVTRLEQLDKSRTQENNRLKVSQDKGATRSGKRMLKHIKKEIELIKDEITKVVSKNKALNKQVELLTSINGIGNMTAWSILAYIGDVRLFGSSKQISSYAGLNPKIEQSGTSIQRSSLSKMGNARLRKSLYMPAIVAMRHNPLMVDLYARLLKKGKPKKLAIVAIMRKLLVIAYGVLKSEKMFDANHAKRA
jgi:transposase